MEKLKYNQIEKGINYIFELNIIVTDGVGYIAKMIESNDLDEIITSMYNYIIQIISDLKDAKKFVPFSSKIPLELSSIKEKEKSFALELINDMIELKKINVKLTSEIIDSQLVKNASKKNILQKILMVDKHFGQ